MMVGPERGGPCPGEEPLAVVHLDRAPDDNWITTEPEGDDAWANGRTVVRSAEASDADLAGMNTIGNVADVNLVWGASQSVVQTERRRLGAPFGGVE